MTTFEPYAALAIPAEARVDRRVPKTLLIEHGTFAAGDRRLIGEGIEELRWLAALQPGTVGIAAYRGPAREYLEVAVLRLGLRGAARASRLAEIIHRAVPYPVVLLTWRDGVPEVSLAHKRRSLVESGATVIDGEVETARIDGSVSDEAAMAFYDSLSLARQPRDSLQALYQGWIDNVHAYNAAKFTGAFTLPTSREQAASRATALRELRALEAEIAKVRTAAGKEKQVARRVEMNLEVACLRDRRQTARARL